MVWNLTLIPAFHCRTDCGLLPLVCLEAFLCHLQWTTGNSNSCPTRGCLLFLGSLHWCVSSCSASTEPSHPLTSAVVPLLKPRIPMLWPDQCLTNAAVWLSDNQLSNHSSSSAHCHHQVCRWLVHFKCSGGLALRRMCKNGCLEG